jgi:hypothetical protein
MFYLLQNTDSSVYFNQLTGEKKRKERVERGGEERVNFIKIV